MLIWDYIRDFLVQHIFGGVDSTNHFYQCTIGNMTSHSGSYFIGNTATTYVPINLFTDDLEETVDFISIGDWLSTTTTIIIMCLIVVLFAMLVRWVFKTVVSAFLLR